MCITQKSEKFVFKINMDGPRILIRMKLFVYTKKIVQTVVDVLSKVVTI